MAEFATLLASRDDLEGDVFDVLVSFSEFDEFKAVMLSHKAEKAWQEGEQSVQLW